MNISEVLDNIIQFYSSLGSKIGLKNWQLWAIGFMLYEQPIGWFSPLQFGYLLLYISAALTLWSMVTYLIAAWPSLAKDS